MKSLWIKLLQKSIAALLGKDWNAVVTQVANLWNADFTGEEKKIMVFDTLRYAGVSAATWLLYAGIEIAYGAMKAKFDETETT